MNCYTIRIMVVVAGMISTCAHANKFVLTGGWGVGKTTIINLLHKHGYATVPEACTLLSDEAKAQGKAEHFWADYPSCAFSKRLMEKQLSLEGALDERQCAFLDRSTIEVVAFATYEKVKLSSDMYSVLTKDRYPIIFCIEPVPKDMFSKVKAEYGSYEQSVKLHEFLKKFYKDIGCTVIEVPFDAPEKRMHFILKSALSICAIKNEDRDCVK